MTKIGKNQTTASPKESIENEITDNTLFEDEYQIIVRKNSLEIRPTIQDIDYEKLSELAAKYGYNVSTAAFQHNHECWQDDYKSGYNDADRYFVFSACGCNDLYFHIEHYTGASYQHTYYA